MKKEDRYKAEIEKLDHHGRGICRIGNVVVFVDNAIPGDIVDIAITEVKKKYALAKIVGFIEPSKNRLKPKCKYFGVCGGCDLMHISYSSQLNFKQNKIEEIINKFTDVDLKLIKPIVKTNYLGYRNKLTLHVVDGKMGLYKRKSNDIVLIDQCLLVDSSINKVLSKIRNIDLTYVSEIVIRKSFNTDDMMIVFDCIKDIDRTSLNELSSDFTSVFIKFGDKYELISGNSVIYEKIGRYKYQISPSSFFQVNSFGCEILYNIVLNYASKYHIGNLLDLYCGTGTIGIYLSDIAKYITGIEINSDAIKNARANALENNVLNAEFICSNASNSKNIVKSDFDLIVVDPPRSGLDDNTIKFLFDNKPKVIIYVSCDPNTLARDLNKLFKKYEVLEITPVDMFPNTYHVECVTILHKRGNKYDNRV